MDQLLFVDGNQFMKYKHFDIPAETYIIVFYLISHTTINIELVTQLSFANNDELTRSIKNQMLATFGKKI